MRDFIEESKRLIRMRSITADGNEEVANALGDLMRDSGLKVTLQQVTHSMDNVSKRQFNVIGVLGDPLVDKKTKKGLLLTSPIDTVSPGLLTNWTETHGDPFNPIIKNGKIYGLGSADGKLDLLCKLQAAQKFRDKKLRMPIYVVGTCAEEAGMLGAKYLIKSGTLNPKFVVVGETSGLSVIRTHKTACLMKVQIGFQMVMKDARGFNRRIIIRSKGRAAHSAFPSAGMNAIHTLFDLVRESMEQGYDLKFTKLIGGDLANQVPDTAEVEFYLTAHQFEDYKKFFQELVKQMDLESQFELESSGIVDSGIRFLPDTVFECSSRIVDHFRRIAQQFSKVKDDSFSPPHSTVNFSLLRQTLSGFELLFDLRILPDQSLPDIEAELMRSVGKIGEDYPSLNLSTARDRLIPALDVSEEQDLVRICKDALITSGLPVKVGKKSCSSEACQYAMAGFESIAFGPGDPGSNSHAPNEHNSIEQLEQAVHFYEKLIERVCL